MRNALTQKTVKKLFAASGGICAFPGCATKLIDQHSGALLGEMCHIKAASEGGPRYDPSQTDTERNESDNLVILCPTHHSLVDQDPVTYSADALLAIKVQHEARMAAIIDAATLPINETQAKDLSRQVDEESVDFAIVVALPKELEALKLYFPELRAKRTDKRFYYTANIPTRLGASYRIVVTLLPCIGNLESAHATSELIRDWNPRFILVNGIAGGLCRKNQSLGDIVVSESIVYYELGKIRDAGVERRNKQFPSDRTLLEGVHNLSSSAWRLRLPSRPDGAAASDEIPRIHVGPIASGEKIIAAAEEVSRLREGQRNLIAVEMESAGVASVAFSALKKIGFIVIRSICDFADASKNDQWQEYAARSAASFLRELLDSRPVAPSEGRWPIQMADASPSQLDASVAIRRKLFHQLCNAIDFEEFKNFCFLIGVDTDELPGDRKSSRVRELILLFERRDQVDVLQSAVSEFLS